MGPEWEQNGATFLVQFRDLPSEGFLVAGSEGRVFLSSEVFRNCFSVSLPGFSHVARTEKLRCPAHAAFRAISWTVTKVCCNPQQHGSFAATRVVLSVLQDARSCAEVAHAVLGMRSLKDGVTLLRPVRQVLPAVRCCGLLAVACKADSACYICWFLPDICRPCWVLCFLFTQEQDDDPTVREDGRLRLGPLKSRILLHGHAKKGGSDSK